VLAAGKMPTLLNLEALLYMRAVDAQLENIESSLDSDTSGINNH